MLIRKAETVMPSRPRKFVHSTGCGGTGSTPGRFALGARLALTER
jgi:hypothetical protein